ncbi:molybdopterin-guanine dinucleotide biosynthesis protein A [Caulobacter ginsengisoli]|uniref:Molybdenum cofactor guanylyltransferase n=1 Tax=Caulobacter ginsengisoli TaxID=400775 RepID=A0ABU0ITS9_9CAUL|nr:molybdenum cofactor guanylyltransferase [Caulobacter ginsengisoli]MDQ0465408.1 molybdopterin-guanine dinucleotide biosynthesis protein A [Caulobacter ginsengisoli]
MIAGLVLAGGRSSRFGSDKAAALLDGRPLLDWALDALRPHCMALAVSGPGGLADAPGDPDGPLSGVKAGLIWAREIGASRLATLPCDVPRVPADLVPCLAAVDARVVSARTVDGSQPLCALWSVDLLDAITAELAAGHPSIQDLQARLGGAQLLFENERAFRNVNRPEDLPPLAGEVA